MRRRDLARALIAVAAVVGCYGCYKPKIDDGGLRCAEGNICPDGFHCAANGTCKKGGPTACQPSSPHLDPLPMCTPVPGNDCDPVCQSRCDCGRCTLMGATLTCVPPGTKKRGDFCDPDADDCEPGNVCLWDCDGLVGRCFRFCGRSDVQDGSLCGGQMCNVPVDVPDGGTTDLWVCPPPPQTCNPIGDNNSCGNAALGCYFDDTVNSTVCDCKGKKQPGEGCSVFNSCVAGYRCVTLSVVTGPICLRTCTVNPNDCPSGTCEAAGGGGLGYCPP